MESLVENILTVFILLVTMDLFCGRCRKRSACTYMQSDLALHSTLLYHNFLSPKPVPMSFNPFPYNPWFLCVCSTSHLKTLLEKEKLLVTSNFSFSHSVFYPLGELSAIFHQIQNCRLQSLSVWKSLNLSFGKVLTNWNACLLSLTMTFRKDRDSSRLRRWQVFF